MNAARDPASPEKTKATFDADGFAAFHPLLDGEQMVEVNKQLDRFLSAVVPAMPADRVYREDPEDPSSIKQLQKMFEYDPWAEELIEQSQIREVAETVLGEPVRAVNMQYFNKPPGIGKPTPPHQDGYFFHLNPCRAVTGWLALEPVYEENGCVHYVRGSHRQEGFRPHAPSGVLGFSQAITDFGTQADHADTVAMPGGPGTFLIHDAKTVHWAGANTSSTRSRRALGFIYYAKSAVFDEEAHAAYQKLLKDQLAAEGRI
ncbi:MAG: phytanoyl-CoA dioxygenase family protein [Pseudomonadota bacterium]